MEKPEINYLILIIHFCNFKFYKKYIEVNKNILVKKLLDVHSSFNYQNIIQHLDNTNISKNVPIHFITKLNY